MIDKKYLPSEKFVIRIVIIIIAMVFIFGIIELVKYAKNGIENRINKNKTPKTLLISNVIEKDSNNNGIPDWEEYLWGLDPEKNGKSNKEFINSKKENLNKNGIIQQENSLLSPENETLSQYFFATIVSLMQSGEINEESLKEVSNAFGENISALEIDSVYSRTSLTIIDDTVQTKKEYSKKISNLIEKYGKSDIGKELVLLAQAISSNDNSAIYSVITVSELYQKFASELIQIPVPESMSEEHLKIANGYEKNGVCVKGMSQYFSDPILGMNSILSYKKYHDELFIELESFAELLLMI